MIMIMIMTMTMIIRRIVVIRVRVMMPGATGDAMSSTYKYCVRGGQERGSSGEGHPRLRGGNLLREQIR